MMGADSYESEETAKGDSPRIGIGEGTTIKRAIIDKNAAIGNGVRLINQARHEEYEDPEGRLFVRDGIIVVPKGCVIPHDFVF
jgi:glucose-1-phosphate adenylyltransferase